MKLHLLALAVLFAACSDIHTTVGPKPDVKPVMVSNRATIKDIQATRAELKSSQQNFTSGFAGLKAVEQYLAILLNTPSKDQGPLIFKAQEQLHEGMSQFAQAAEKVAQAEKRAADAEQHGEATQGYAEVLEQRVGEAYDREIALAKDNVMMKPVYEECTKWHGIGAIIFGVKTLLKSLLWFGLFAGGLVAALFALSFFFPVIGVGLRIAGGFFSGLYSRARGFASRVKIRVKR